jgi:hypothetical protein
MKRKIRNAVNNILKSFGVSIIPQYETTHMQFKYDEALNELYAV